MTIIEQIIEELSDSSKSLTNPLLKARVIASRIGNHELEKWVNDELAGYGADNLPNYRIARSTITCSIQQGYMVQENVPFPLMTIPREMSDEMIKFRITDSVQTLESQERENRNGTMYKELGADMCAYITKKIIENGQRFAVTKLMVTVHTSQITQVLSVIRSRFLDFMLQLEKEVPDLDEIIKNKLVTEEKVNEKVEKIYNQTIINNSGYGNTITAGNENVVTSNINITKGNIKELQEVLESNNVPKEDIAEIVEIVQEESPDPSTGRFGEKVNSWINKMISKTLEGTWLISTGAAGALLVELLKKYYGF